MSKNKGIYCWLNKINGKRYVGQTGCKGGFSKRWTQEKYYLNRNIYQRLNKHFCHSWNKYGKQNFESIELEVIENPTKQMLTEREQYWCDLYKSNDPAFGYNKRICVESNLGYKSEISEKSRLHMASILSVRFAGDKSVTAKLSWPKVKKIRQDYATKIYSMQQLADEHNMSRKAIGAVVHNKTWKDPTYVDPGSCRRRKKKLYKRSKKPRLTENKIRLIRGVYAEGEHTYEQIAEFFGIGWRQVHNIVKRKAWKNII